MSMKIVILGLLMEGEKHPYEIQQIMKERNMDKYIRFQKGSLYYAFERLTKDGLIEVSNVVRDSNRPDRTIHRITEAGRKEFNRLLYEQFNILEPYHDPIYAALCFARYGDEEKIAHILGDRIEVLEKVLAHIKLIYEDHRNQLSRASLHVMMGGIAHTETELKWLRQVYQDAKEGNLSQVDPLPIPETK